MTYEVTVQTIPARIVAAVRREVAPNDVGRVFKPALDKVWAFLRQHPGLRTDGHNIFLYHHKSPELLVMDFGVEVVRGFAADGEIDCVTTPVGEAAVVVHRGPYTGLGAAHRALRDWCAKNGRTIGSNSLEIYGHWSDDPVKLETTIEYLLR